MVRNRKRYPVINERLFSKATDLKSAVRITIPPTLCAIRYEIFQPNFRYIHDSGGAGPRGDPNRNRDHVAMETRGG